MRKPRRKKSKFKFKSTNSAGIIMMEGDTLFVKDVGPVKYLGECGYHVYFANSFTVFHIPTGLEIKHCNTKKEAIILVKKIFVKKLRIRSTSAEIIELLKLKNLSCSLGGGLYVAQRDLNESENDIPF